MDSEGHIPTSVAADILAALYPVLLSAARAELKARGEDPQLAEDIVQDVTASWFELTSTDRRAENYMRKAIKNRVADLKRPKRDVASRHPLSLDEFPEQIEEL